MRRRGIRMRTMKSLSKARSRMRRAVSALVMNAEWFAVRTPILLFCIIVLFAWSTECLRAQTTSATINGQITDAQGRAVPGVDVQAVNIDTNVVRSGKTNDSGIYAIPALPPGRYRLLVMKDGFKEINKTDLVLDVEDPLEQNFGLAGGSMAESVTVTGGGPNINTTDASVSTVVDRQFAENLPLNGRSFQTLIQLTPGVVLTTTNANDAGQFSVNGQRAASNYWMVDGVSGNIGTGVNPAAASGNSLGGAVGSFSALCGTNSLVSVDALQEFRIQTSTYAPEFGRTPGGQISIVTRSGTNQFHGTLFDYFRNAVLDANDWFANSAGLTRPEERQNDFGGTFSGPIFKNRTFFFFSYEGLRLRLPQTALTTVPDLAARQNALPAIQPFLNAFPLPNGTDNAATSIAQFNASFVNPATLDAYSIRIDHKVRDNLAFFARYNYSPSENDARGGTITNNPLSTVFSDRITIQTATAGATWTVSPTIVNDLRFNYSRADTSGDYHLDNFGGAVPLASIPFPSPFTSQNATFGFTSFLLKQGALFAGHLEQNLQRQINIVDSVSVQKGSHSLKFGADFRRLSPFVAQSAYLQGAIFLGVSSAETGSLLASVIGSSLTPTFLFRNLGAYAQDTWRIVPRLTVTYGLRWDVDFSPQSLDGPSFPAVTGFKPNDFSNLGLASAGTPPYKTTYGNFAPRLGIAYQLSDSQEWATVLRGGFGIFYDLASSEAGNAINVSSYPFGSAPFRFGGTFPLSPAAAAPPAITPPSAANPGMLLGFDPGLELPYTFQWNVALEQGLGKQQTISASYIGAAGRRLLQSILVLSPNASITQAQFVTNTATSDYDALQLQFRRRLSHGIQALASYTWAHSIDTGSAGSIGNFTNVLTPTAGASSNRGPSDFDIRHAFSIGFTYDVPVPKINAFTSGILGGWSLQSVIQGRSSPPVDISDANFFQFNACLISDILPHLFTVHPLLFFL